MWADQPASKLVLASPVVTVPWVALSQIPKFFDLHSCLMIPISAQLSEVTILSSPTLCQQKGTEFRQVCLSFSFKSPL